MSIEIVYETHSTSTDNEAGIATGWLPGRLSAEGRRQARELGARRCNDGVAAVFVSDLARATETAELAFAASDIPVFTDARLRECDYGELNGAAMDRVALERARHIDEPFPGGQSYRQVVAGMRDFLRELVSGWDGSRVVLIGHSATRWALEHLLAGVALEDLVDAPFEWKEGWTYLLPSGWTGAETA